MTTFELGVTVGLQRDPILKVLSEWKFCTIWLFYCIFAYFAFTAYFAHFSYSAYLVYFAYFGYLAYFAYFTYFVPMSIRKISTKIISYPSESWVLPILVVSCFVLYAGIAAAFFFESWFQIHLFAPKMLMPIIYLFSGNTTSFATLYFFLERMM